VSVPLKSRRGVTLGAIGVSMNTSSCTAEAAVERCVPALLSTAQALMDLM
jgi:DNA-binding IclR family transcriptional regulator